MTAFSNADFSLPPACLSGRVRLRPSFEVGADASPLLTGDDVLVAEAGALAPFAALALRDANAPDDAFVVVGMESGDGSAADVFAGGTAGVLLNGLDFWTRFAKTSLFLDEPGSLTKKPSGFL